MHHQALLGNNNWIQTDIVHYQPTISQLYIQSDTTLIHAYPIPIHASNISTYAALYSLMVPISLLQISIRLQIYGFTTNSGPLIFDQHSNPTNILDFKVTIQLSWSKTNISTLRPVLLLFACSRPRFHQISLHFSSIPVSMLISLIFKLKQ